MRAKRALGQNFLVSGRMVQRIVRAAKLDDSDTILEIGPGRGALTRQLLATGRPVIAIEKDHELAALLPDLLGDRLTVICADLLDLDLEQTLPDGPLVAVGNLPYNVSVPILFRLLDCRHRLRHMVLMFQREVAERLAAAPGSKKYGIPTVMAQLVANVEHLFDLPPEAFRPQPKIWSSVIRVTPLAEPRVHVGDTARFRDLLTLLFQHRRKTIGRILRNHGRQIPPEAPLDLSRRPETLSLEDLATLSAWLDGRAAPLDTI